MTNADRVQILRSAVEDMAQFIRDNQPASIPEEKSMSIKIFVTVLLTVNLTPQDKKLWDILLQNPIMNI